MQSLKTLDPSIFVSITKRIYVEMELINIAKVRPLSTSSVAPWSWLQSDQASGDITLPRYLGIQPHPPSPAQADHCEHQHRNSFKLLSMFTVLEIVLVGGNTIGSQNTNTDANEITNKLRLFHFTITIYPLCKKLSPCSPMPPQQKGEWSGQCAGRNWLERS